MWLYDVCHHCHGWHQRWWWSMLLLSALEGLSLTLLWWFTWWIVVSVWVIGGCRCGLASGHPQVHPCMLCRSWRNGAAQRWKNGGIVNTAERYFQDQGTHIIFLFQSCIYICTLEYWWGDVPQNGPLKMLNRDDQVLLVVPTVDTMISRLI